MSRALQVLKRWTRLVLPDDHSPPDVQPLALLKPTCEKQHLGVVLISKLLNCSTACLFRLKDTRECCTIPVPKATRGG